MRSACRYGLSSVLLGAVLFTAPAVARAAEPSGSDVTRAVSCATDARQCDVDADEIADLVEEAICGSATCATGVEDHDGDGLSDAAELSGELDAAASGDLLVIRDGDLRLLVSDRQAVVVPIWAGALAVAAAGCAVVAGVCGVRVVRARAVKTGVDA